MSIRILYPVDQLALADLIDNDWVSATLWVANSPDGVYTLSAVTPSPATLALAVSGETYEFTFECTTETPGQYFKVRYYDGISAYSSLSDASPFHGGGGTTFSYLKSKIGRRIRDYWAVSSVAGGGTTSVKTSDINVVRHLTDAFVGWIYRNATSGEQSVVTASSVTAGVCTLTFSPAILTQAAAGISMELFKRFTHEEMREALNEAISYAYPSLSRSLVNQGLRTQAAGDDTVYLFQVPQDFRIVNKLEMESLTWPDSTDEATHGQPWLEVPFESDIDGLIRTLKVRSKLPDDRRLRISGIGILSQLYNDSDYVEVVHPQTELLTDLACAFLYKLQANDGASSDTDRFNALSDYYLSKFEKNKGRLGTPRKPTSYWAHDSLVSVGGYPRRDVYVYGTAR